MHEQIRILSDNIEALSKRLDTAPSSVQLPSSTEPADDHEGILPELSPGQQRLITNRSIIDNQLSLPVHVTPTSDASTNLTNSTSNDSNPATAAANLKSVHLLGPKASIPPLSEHFHVSRFDINVTPDRMVDYISINAIVKKDRLIVRRLTKKGQDVTTLKHVNFKVETDQETAKIITQKIFWPNHVEIKNWTKRSSMTSTTPSFL